MLQYYLFSKQSPSSSYAWKFKEGRAVRDRTDGVDVHCEKISQLFGLGKKIGVPYLSMSFANTICENTFSTSRTSKSLSLSISLVSCVFLSLFEPFL
jgi:hypothetical protein